MANFPVSTLEPHLLEKVIQKLDLKSYYRLQRTCSEMVEFIHNTPNLKLSIRCNQIYYLTYNKATCSWKCEGSRPAKGIFGQRVGMLTIRTEHDHPVFHGKPYRFQSLCAFLKKHRITCGILDLYPNAGITKEQFKALLNIVKPQTIEIASSFARSAGEGFMYDVLLEPKLEMMENVTLHVDPDVFVDVLHRFLPAFPQLVIDMNKPCNDPINLIRSILEMLDQPLPRLREFLLIFHYHENIRLFSKSVMKKIVGSRKTTTGKDIFANNCIFVELPSHFPKDSTFRLSKLSHLGAFIAITMENMKRSTNSE